MLEYRLGAGPYVGGPQCHRRVAQKRAGILKVGHVMQLDAVHAPDPHGVHAAHDSTFPTFVLAILANICAALAPTQKSWPFSKLRVATAPRQQIRGESDHGVWAHHRLTHSPKVHYRR